MQLWLFIIVANFIWATGEIPEIPYEDLTPGTICTEKHSDFKEFRYHEDIPYCRRNVSSQLKRQVYQAYGIPPKCRSQYTIDHFIPLSIGGDNEFSNLWPEHKEIKKTRKDLEFHTYLALRNGEIDQADAIAIIYEAKLNPNLPPDWQEDIYCGKVVRYRNISSVEEISLSW